MKRAVTLIAMPWASVRFPSIQVGTLKVVLDHAGFPCTPYSLAVHWLEFLQQHSGDATRLSLAEYELVGAWGTSWGLADWVFALPPVRAASPARDTELLASARQLGAPDDLIAKLPAARALAPAFLDEWADRILADQPLFVGFSTTYSQNHASLCLAHRIKQRAPSMPIVFGGANCEGVMGSALQRAFPWVDIVVRGAGEGPIVSIARDLKAGRAPASSSQISLTGSAVVNHQPAALSQMGEVPTPDYDEYFAAIERTSFYDDAMPDLVIPFEASRGCWWGAKHHCTFCGLNADSMAFRSKDPDLVLAEIQALSARYGCRRLTAVDNIIDWHYFESVLPQLRQAQLDLSIFYELKANLTKAQVRLLKESGVDWIQPGIESLSTPILSLMKKGITALQNIRLLKWCAEFQVRPSWHLIYGFPSEPAEEYRRMAALAPSLFHLNPPRLIPLAVYRFSPYHSRPEAFGIELTRPNPTYRHLYDLPDDVLRDIAYDFEYRYHDGRIPGSYIAEIQAAVDAWRVAKDRGASLAYHRGPAFLEITDTRGEDAKRIVLQSHEAAIYQACDRGRTIPALVEDPRLSEQGISEPEIRAFLLECVAERLMYEESGTYLSLAVGTGKHLPWDAASSDVPHRTREPQPSRPAPVERQHVIPLTVA